MSDIQGEGYGSCHDWKYQYTSSSRASYYVCRVCGEGFSHHYPSEPNIFKAMREVQYVSGQIGVKEKCEPTSTEPEGASHD